MTHYSRQTDQSHTITLPSSIDRCFWSRRVAVNGDTVKMHVETSFVRDGTTVQLAVMEGGAEARQVAEIESSALSNNELVLEHTIELAEDQGAEQHGATRDARELFFTVRIPEYGLDNENAPSTVLTIDTAPFKFSE